MKNNSYICHMSYLRSSIAYDHDFWYTCVMKMMISPGGFYHFFEIFIFQVVWVVKRQKIVQNDKKLCLLCSVSQETYIMWLSFVVCKCKMVSSGIFLIFSKFWFFRLLGGLNGKKMTQNDKNCLPCLISQ